MLSLTLGCDSNPPQRSQPIPQVRSPNQIKTVESADGTAKRPSSEKIDSERLAGDSDKENQQNTGSVGLKSNETDTSSESPSQPAFTDLEQLHEAVIEALDLGELDDAWKLVRQAKRQDPTGFETRYLMARVLADRNRFTEAIQLLDDLAETDPQIELPVLGQTAEWLVLDGRWDEGEKRYRKIISAIEDIGMVQRRLAELLIRKGERTEACRYFMQLCEAGNIEEAELRTLLNHSRPDANPEPADELEPIGKLGNARSLAGKSDFNSAIQLIKESQPDDPETFSLLGRLLVSIEDFENLDDWLQKTDTRGEKYPDYWFAKGAFSQHKDQHKEAIQNFCEALLLDPTDAGTYRQLAKSLTATDQVNTASQVNQRAQVIEETQRLGLMLVDSSVREPKIMIALCDSLDSLNRPLESLAWQAIGMVYNQATSGMTGPELKSQLQQINQRRVRLIESGRANASAEFILCGIARQRPNDTATK